MFQFCGVAGMIGTIGTLERHRLEPFVEYLSDRRIHHHAIFLHSNRDPAVESASAAGRFATSGDSSGVRP